MTEIYQIAVKKEITLPSTIVNDSYIKGFSLLGVQDMSNSPSYKYAMAIAAALMAGWTVLLIWADHKPVERRGVLLLTIFLVKVCLDLANVYLLYYKILTVSKFIVMRIDAIFIYGLFIFSYVYSESLAKKMKNTDQTQ